MTIVACQWRSMQHSLVRHSRVGMYVIHRFLPMGTRWLWPRHFCLRCRVDLCLVTVVPGAICIDSCFCLRGSGLLVASIDVDCATKQVAVKIAFFPWPILAKLCASITTKVLRNEFHFQVFRTSSMTFKFLEETKSGDPKTTRGHPSALIPRSPRVTGNNLDDP